MERKEMKVRKMMERETEDETHSKDLGGLSFLCHALWKTTDPFLEYFPMHKITYTIL